MNLYGNMAHTQSPKTVKNDDGIPCPRGHGQCAILSETFDFIHTYRSEFTLIFSFVSLRSGLDQVTVLTCDLRL